MSKSSKSHGVADFVVISRKDLILILKTNEMLKKYTNKKQQTTIMRYIKTSTPREVDSEKKLLKIIDTAIEKALPDEIVRITFHGTIRNYIMSLYKDFADKKTRHKRTKKKNWN